MNASDIPAWFVKKFGQDATASYIRSVPATTADPAAASMALGFPPQTFTDEGAGGTPPDGRDFNGILNFLSSWVRWQGAGGGIPFNATIAANGGYPKGARLVSSANPALTWVSTVDANTTNPDSGGAANWRAEGDLGHDYDINGGFVTIGPLILNFGHVTFVGSSGFMDVTFDKPFPTAPLWPGATNDSGPSYPQFYTGTGSYTQTGMRVGQAFPAPGGGSQPASAGSAANWWCLGY